MQKLSADINNVNASNYNGDNATIHNSSELNDLTIILEDFLWYNTCSRHRPSKGLYSATSIIVKYLQLEYHISEKHPFLLFSLCSMSSVAAQMRFQMKTQLKLKWDSNGLKSEKFRVNTSSSELVILDNEHMPVC